MTGNLKGIADKLLSGVIAVFFLSGMYLGLTALPPFLGLAGVLPRPAGPEPIADAIARLVLSVVSYAIAGVVWKIQQRFTRGKS
jgi:hypothetical protein